MEGDGGYGVRGERGFYKAFVFTIVSMVLKDFLVFFLVFLFVLKGFLGDCLEGYGST